MDEYRDALIKLDELSLMLGKTLAHLRIGWDDFATCEGVLDPLNQIAKQIGEAIPESIKATRLPEPPKNIKHFWEAANVPD